MNILILAPNRTGSSNLDNTLANYLNLYKLTTDYFSLSHTDNFTKSGLYDIFRPRIGTTHNLLKLHPSTIPFDFSCDNYGVPEFYRYLTDIISFDKVFGLLRKDLFDTAVSLKNVNERMKFEEENVAFTSPYELKWERPTKTELFTIIQDTFLTVLLAKSFNFPIFWYEEIYTGNPESLYPLFNFLGLEEELVSKENFFLSFDTSKKFRKK